MRYMTSFHRRLRQLRDLHQLEAEDLAELCDVDERRIRSWENPDPEKRDYPDIDELMDLCFKTGTRLETLLDFEDAPDAGQLELPGLASSGDADLTRALDTLEQQLEALEEQSEDQSAGKTDLTEEETEMLRRFREASSENRRMIIQLMA